MALQTLNPFYDNNIQVTGQATWTTARDASSGTIGSASATNFNLRAEKISGSDFRLSRVFMFFDTSFILQGGSVSAATLRINVETLVAGIDLGLVTATPASQTEVVGDDFDQTGSTEFASRVSAATTGIKTFTLNASGLAAINVTGNTIFAVRQERDLDDVEPTGSDSGAPAISSADNATEGNRPLLTVTFVSGVQDDIHGFFLN